MIVVPHTDFVVAGNHAENEIENEMKMKIKKQEPFSMNGFFPLYHTHESAMKYSPSGSVHSHKFNDGNVYYMPEGTEIFHGDYQHHHHHHRASRKFLKHDNHNNHNNHDHHDYHHDNNEIVLTFRIDKDICIQLLLVLILVVITS